MARLPHVALALVAALVAVAPAQAGPLDGVPVPTVPAVVSQVIPPVVAPVVPPSAPPAPAPPEPVTTVVDSVTGVLDTATGGAVSGATGTAGGVLSGAGGQLGGTLESILTAGGGATGGGAGSLPASTVTTLLSFLGASGTAGGAQGTAGPGGAGGQAVVVDGRAPRAVVSAVSKLRSTAKTGRLVLRVTLDEPGVVVLGGTLRPGKARKGQTVSRKPIHFPAAVLGYRKAGALRVTVMLSRAAQRRLAGARDGRLSIQTLAVDAARNQARGAVKRHLAR